MANKTLGILLRFVLDKNALSQAVQGIDNLDDVLEDAVEGSDDLRDSFFDLSKEMDILRKRSAEVQGGLNKIKATGELLGGVGTQLSVFGTALTGGILASANNYVSFMKEAGLEGEESVERWVAATDRLKESNRDVGRVALTAALPIIEKAAELVEKAADFVEDNPEIVKAALNAGLVVATIGALGLAVSQGIKLYADVALLAATAQETINALIIKKAAEKNLEAAVLQSANAKGLITSLGDPKALATTLGKFVGQAAVLAAAAYVGAKGGLAVGNVAARSLYGPDYQDQTGKDALETAKRISALISPLNLLSKGAEGLGLISQESRMKVWDFVKRINGLGDSAEDAGDQADGATDKLENNTAALAKYNDFLEEENAASQKLASDRADIIRDAAKQVSAADGTLQSALSGAASNLAESLSSIASSFSSENAAAAADYATRRADIVRDGGQEIQRIEQDHQAAMIKLSEDHDIAVLDLVQQRDALGLVRAQEIYERERSEAESDVNQSIAERRQDIATKLADEARSFAQARAQRLQQYIQDLAEAKKQNALTVVQAKKDHAADLERIQAEKGERLAELQRSYNEERAARRKAAFDTIKDVSDALTAERLMKQRFYQAMLADSTAFMGAVSSSSRGGAPGLLTGGYAMGAGVRNLAEDGKREFVMNNQSTMAAESIVGGSLTQDRLLGALRQGRRGLTLNDHRRFDGDISPGQVRQIKRDTMLDLAEAIQE